MRQRNRRMTSLETMTRRFVRDQENEAFQHAFSVASLGRILGDTVAGHIASVHREGNRLVLVVPERSWRRELKIAERHLLAKVRQIRPGLEKVVILAEPR